MQNVDSFDSLPLEKTMTFFVVLWYMPVLIKIKVSTTVI